MCKNGVDDTIAGDEGHPGYMSIMDKLLKQINSLLPRALAEDRFKAARALRRLEKAGADKRTQSGIEKQLKQLKDRLQSSADRRRRRRARCPRVSFDPTLPITARKDDIIGAIRKNQVVIVSGETGSGKSTQLPKMCLAAGRGIDGKIGCTQPRRIAATSIARRIAEELGEEPNRSVGYKIRFQDRTRKDAFIKVMTDGILLAEAQVDPYLREYDTIIVDEAHERSLNIDFSLGLIRTLLKKRSELKLIITSATIDTEKFSQAFDHAPIVDVSGRLFPVDVLYYPDDPLFRTPPGARVEEPGHVETAVDAVDKIIATGFDGDVLVFMPTEQDIRECCDLLADNHAARARILPLFARLTAAQQSRVFASGGKRKIVVATNVAETSLTIPGIKYVVDTGLARISRYNPRSRTTALPIVPVSKSSADQRKGRCGRVRSGVCIRLFSGEDYEQRPAHTLPEILRSNLAEVILRMMSLNLGDINAFPFIDTPDPRSVKDGYRLLEELGAIEKKPPPAKRSRRTPRGKENDRQPPSSAAYRLTKTGRLMARLPIDPRLARMLIEARDLGVLEEVVIIAAALSIQDPRERPADSADEADRMQAPFQDPKSDFLTVLNIWKQYHQRQAIRNTGSQMRKYCRQHFLSYRRMREWQDIHRQVHQILKENRLRAKAGTTSDENVRYEGIHRAVLSGFLSNVAHRKDKNLYSAARGREVMLFPGSGVFNTEAQWIVAAEMVRTSRLFARSVATVQAEWIEEIGRDFCRSTYTAPHWSVKREQVVASEQISLFGLIIVPQRTVAYGPIDPVQATEIFIRRALVDGDVRNPLPFMRHNRALIDEVRGLEERIRRRDMLVGDDQLERFYAKRLGVVTDMPGLEKRIRERNGDGFLRMRRSDVMIYQPGEEILSRFPRQVALGNRVFPADYHFDPGSDQDGLTVRVPSDVAPRVTAEASEWLVPGLLEEKLTALIKALPKKYRKRLVPVSETVAIVVAEMPRSGGSLISVLAEFIFRRFGISIPADAWAADSLPEYLNMRFAVTGPGGEILRAGRDRSILKQDISQELHLQQWDALREKWERRDVTGWDFGDLPEAIEVASGSTTSWTVFPGLQVDSDSGRIDLRLFRNSDAAAQAHRRGVAALYRARFARELRFLKKSLLLPAELAAAAAAFGGNRKFGRQMFDAVTDSLFCRNIRNQRVFAEYAAQVGRRIYPAGQQLMEDVLPVMRAWDTAQKRVLRLETANAANRVLTRICADVKRQMERLIPGNFMVIYDRRRLAELPRYLTARAVRVERAAVDSEKDRHKAQQFNEFTEALQRMLDSLSADTSGEKRAALEEYFWMVEEFNVSLFAQELGTAIPVSQKRLEKKLKVLQRML